MLDKLVNFICFRVTLFNYPDPIQVRGSEVGQIMEVFQVVLMRYLEKTKVWSLVYLVKGPDAIFSKRKFWRGCKCGEGCVMLVGKVNIF